MAVKNFVHSLNMQWEQNKFLCVAMDTALENIPARMTTYFPVWPLLDKMSLLSWFNDKIIDATGDVVCAYKLNFASYFEKYGTRGYSILESTVRYIKAAAPTVPIILDARWGHVADTNSKYAAMAFDDLQADDLQVDAVTVSPYIGEQALHSFLQYTDKGVFVLCRTSDPGSDDLQNMPVGKQHLFHYVAERVATKWNEYGNCGVVMSARFPESIREVRHIVGDMPILILGVNPQDGNLEEVTRAGMDKKGSGALIEVSHTIIRAGKCDDNFENAQQEAINLHAAINRCRGAV